MLGTLTAALIVGEPGVVRGVAPGARILALRTEPDYFEPGYSGFFSGPRETDTQPVNAAAIRYAVRHGARVILVDSDSYAAPNPALLAAVSYALSQNAVIVAPVPSTSRKWSWEYQYPSGLPGVIGVSAVMLPGGEPPFSSFTAQRNNSVLISGPADTVTASVTDWQLDDFATAAAYAAATVALIKERYPALRPALVARALAMSARYRPRGGYSPSAGFGVLDPYDAIIDAGRLAASAGRGGGGGGRRGCALRRRTAARPHQRTAARRPAARAVLGAARAAARSCSSPSSRLAGASAHSSFRSRNRSRMLASIFTRPAIQARAMFIGDSASDITSPLFAVSRMSAGGSPGATSRTGSSPLPSIRHVGDAEVGNGDAHRPVAEILFPVGGVQL